MSLSFAPNLRRDRVSFVGDLRFPVRFREAAAATPRGSKAPARPGWLTASAPGLRLLAHRRFPGPAF